MEQFTGKSLDRWGETHTHTHTHTLHEHGAKRQDDKHTLVHWKHLRWTHTHIHSFFRGARQLSFLTAAPYIARKNNFTLNFSTRSFRRSCRKRRKGREYEEGGEEKKKTKLWTHQCFWQLESEVMLRRGKPSVFLPRQQPETLLDSTQEIKAPNCEF